MYTIQSICFPCKPHKGLTGEPFNSLLINLVTGYFFPGTSEDEGTGPFQLEQLDEYVYFQYNFENQLSNKVL